MEPVGRLRTVSTGMVTLNARPAQRGPAYAHLAAYDSRGEMTAQTHCLATESDLLRGLLQLGIPEDEARPLAADFAIDWSPAESTPLEAAWLWIRPRISLALVAIPWLIGVRAIGRKGARHR